MPKNRPKSHPHWALYALFSGVKNRRDPCRSEKQSIFKVSTVFHVLNDRQMRTITNFSVEG